MGIENIKRWHWCVIGLIVGAGFASIKLWAGEEEPAGTQHVRPAEFEEQLLRMWDPLTRSQIGRIDNFKVHSPEPFVVPGGKVDAAYMTYDIYLVERPKAPATKPAALKPGEKPPVYARGAKQFLIVPLQTARDHSLVGPGTEVAKMDLYDYLDKLKAKLAADPKRYGHLPKIEYKYNWLMSPKGAYTVYPAIGLFVIGVIWPTVIGLLTGMGLGRAPSEKGVDLSKVKSRRTSSRPKPVVTQADMDQLSAVEAELEAKLKEGAKPRVATTAEPAAEAPVAVKALNAGPLDTAKEVEKPAEKPKGYGADQGDYYPTEVHGKKPS